MPLKKLFPLSENFVAWLELDFGRRCNPYGKPNTLKAPKPANILMEAPMATGAAILH